MKVSSLIFLAPFLFASGVSADSDNLDFAKSCLKLPLPKFPPANDTRPTPWAGETKIQGKECCNGLDEIRDQIDELDIQIVSLLAARYVQHMQSHCKVIDSFVGPNLTNKLLSGNRRVIVSTCHRETCRSSMKQLETRPKMVLHRILSM